MATEQKIVSIRAGNAEFVRGSVRNPVSGAWIDWREVERHGWRIQSITPAVTWQDTLEYPTAVLVRNAIEVAEDVAEDADGTLQLTKGQFELISAIALISEVRSLLLAWRAGKQLFWSDVDKWLASVNVLLKRYNNDTE